jgi:hypothetical protein
MEIIDDSLPDGLLMFFERLLFISLVQIKRITRFSIYNIKKNKKKIVKKNGSFLEEHEV